MTSPRPRRVVIATPGARQIVERLRALDDVEVLERFDLADTTDPRQLIEGLAGAWAVVAGSEPYTRPVLEALGELRAIVRFGVGYDAIDLSAASDHGVAVLTTPGANAEAVADMAVALMLACIRDVAALDGAVRAGGWRPTAVSGDLALATVAIVGLGAIGRAVARRLRGFGCELLAVEPEPDHGFCSELAIELASLDAALSRADVVTLHAALTPQTHHLLDARALALLPAHAVVVNTSRGGLIDQPALVEALGGARLGGAGLDVFEQEPLAPGDPLLSLSKVIITPHASSATRLGTSATADAVFERLVALLAGVMPAGCLSAPARS